MRVVDAGASAWFVAMEFWLLPMFPPSVVSGLFRHGKLRVESGGHANTGTNEEGFWAFTAAGSKRTELVLLATTGNGVSSLCAQAISYCEGGLRCSSL